MLRQVGQTLFQVSWLGTMQLMGRTVAGRLSSDLVEERLCFNPEERLACDVNHVNMRTTCQPLRLDPNQWHRNTLLYSHARQQNDNMYFLLIDQVSAG